MVTVGKFDGVHTGHASLLEAARANLHGAQHLVAVVFDRHPLSTLRPGSEPPALTSLSRKLHLLGSCGADFTHVLHFDRRRAAQSAHEFAQLLLGQRLRAANVVVGESFRFGHGAAGDVSLLARVGQAEGFDVTVVAKAPWSGAEHVSSSSIRAAIRDGRLDDAAAMLGRPHEVPGWFTSRRARDQILVADTWAMPLAGPVRATVQAGRERWEMEGVLERTARGTLIQATSSPSTRALPVGETARCRLQLHSSHTPAGSVLNDCGQLSTISP